MSILIARPTPPADRLPHTSRQICHIRVDPCIQQPSLGKFICPKEDDSSREGTKESGGDTTIKTAEESFLSVDCRIR